MRKWLVGSIGIFMIGTMLSCLMSGRWLLNGEINIFNALASFNVMSVAAAGGWGVAKTVGSYFNGIITALSWNYPFLDSAWCIFLKIPLWLVSIGTVWGFIELGTTVIQSLASSVSSVIRSFTGG